MNTVMRKTYTANKRDKEKLCLECAQPIPALALKCSKCGAYQNWRRHLGLSQSTVALVLSVLALSGHFVWGGKFISELVTTKFDFVNMSVTDIDEDSIRFLMQNTSKNPIFLESFTCNLEIPAYSAQVFDAVISTFDKGERESKEIITVGSFFLEYGFDTSVPYLPGEATMISSTSSKRLGPSSYDINVGKYRDFSCIINGISGDGQKFGQFVVLEMQDLLEFDLDKMLKDDRLGGMPEDERKKLVEKIQRYTYKSTGLN